MPGRPKPYVGVTGFMTRHDVEAALTTFPSAIHFDLMVGVLVSHKSFRGDRDAIRWPNRYPCTEDVGGIFTDDPKALNLIHFNSRARGRELFQQLQAVVDCGKPHILGLQLNIVWPDPDTLFHFAVDYPGLRIVQQLNRGMLPNAERGWSMQNMIDRLRPYVEQGAITDVLVDASGGTGKGFDFRSSFGVIDALETAFPYLGIGIAGGLCAKTVPELEVLLAVFPFLSIDAEGKLRSGDDHLDLTKVESYLAAFHNSCVNGSPFRH
jgi:hypothetical protein